LIFFHPCFREFFKPAEEGHKLLVVQCDSRDSNQNLVKGAQYCMQDHRPSDCSRHHVVFIVQLPRVAGACFTGFLVMWIFFILTLTLTLFVAGYAAARKKKRMIVDWLRMPDSGWEKSVVNGPNGI
jgi:hypothetical protein